MVKIYGRQTALKLIDPTPEDLVIEIPDQKLSIPIIVS